MNIGLKIVEHRKHVSISQEQLAEHLHVSRQTISNWETGKSYSDIYSISRMSTLFETSIDNLVKEDLKMIKEEVKNDEEKKDRCVMKWLSSLYTIQLIVMVVSLVPLMRFLELKVAIAVMVLQLVLVGYVAFKIERIKKRENIQTYKEIESYMEGASLSAIEQAKEEGKRPYQKVFIVGIVTIASFLIPLFIGLVLF